MPRRRLGVAAVCALALTLALASCVSPEELRREDEATCADYGFHPGTDVFCELSPEGELGATLLGCAASVLGLGLLVGRRLGTVAGAAGPALSLTRMRSVPTPSTAASAVRGLAPWRTTARDHRSRRPLGRQPPITPKSNSRD